MSSDQENQQYREITNKNSEVVLLEEELKSSYLSYALSVISHRAIPDVRDGLKPVHRRVLYSMYKSGYDCGKPYKKAARIIGDVMGKYHPHADSAIYDSLVRMAQDFSLLLPLIDGQGNFGSIDGDPAASIRYTEARLQKSAHFLMNDIEEDSVDFRYNYDGSELEPTVLPAEFPNILVNGASGVAVGMSTNIPTHNIGEVIDGCLMYIDNNDITVADLMTVIPGPDFPTGGIISGRSGIIQAFTTGRGSILVKGKCHIEDLPGDKHAIIVDEIPYQVNKAKLIERIIELIKEKRIEGISEVRDETNKFGIRIYIELKRGVQHEIILNQLMNLTPLSVNFSVNSIVLNNGKPEMMSLPGIIKSFVEFRKEVIQRRTRFRLKKTRERVHRLVGLYVAVLNIDEVVRIIRSSKDPAEAAKRLIEVHWKVDSGITEMIRVISDSNKMISNDGCYLSENQVKAILDMKLQRLTNLEKSKLEDDIKESMILIEGYILILSSELKLIELLKENLMQIKRELSSARKTMIEEDSTTYSDEDLIPKEEMVVTVTMNNYIKRVKLEHYKAQRRGGKGRIGQNVHDEDVISSLFVTNTHTGILFFSDAGKVYYLKTYKLPLAEPNARGRSLVNLLPIQDNEGITSIALLSNNMPKDMNIVFVTASGNVRRNSLEDFEHIPSNGKIAMCLSEGDSLISVKICSENDHILISTTLGKSIRFVANSVRLFKGRSSDGVRAIRLSSDKDRVVSMSILNASEAIDIAIKELYLKVPAALRIEFAQTKAMKKEILKMLEAIGLSEDEFTKLASEEQFILSITENGFGKRTSSYEYRITDRGGSGVTNILTDKRNGNVVACFPVEECDHVILITDKGKIIRIACSEIRISSRNTKGVILFKTDIKESVVSVAKVVEQDDVLEQNLDDVEEEDNEQN